MKHDESLRETVEEPTVRADDPITREQLYELVWTKPMLRIAEGFGVSSSYMARGDP
jgi:hypothetical protein